MAETDVNWMIFAAGVFIVATAVLDALWTTIAFSGGGPITRRLARWAWMAALAFHRSDSSRSHALFKITGTIILLAVVLVWIVMLLGGYLLMFSAAWDAVVQSSSRSSADLAQRFYFVGTLFSPSVAGSTGERTAVTPLDPLGRNSPVRIPFSPWS